MNKFNNKLTKSKLSSNQVNNKSKQESKTIISSNKPQPKKEESVNKLYIKVQNGTKPYINKDGEVVIDLRPGKVNIDIKEISVDGVSFRVVHSYKDKNTGDDKYRIGDRGFIKVNKNHELNISRKTEGKA